MTTLKHETQITGNGLMKNKPCTVKFVPSKEGKIRYFIKDNEPFVACADNVLATDHCVVLGDINNKKAKAMLTEHLTAALAFCGIDSIDIYMDEEEVPALDGSSKQWVELFEKAGIEKVTALIEVRVTPQRGMGFDKVAERIYNYPEVNSVYLISGGFDFMVTIEGKTLREVSQFVSDKLSPLDSVLSAKTNFILKKYKDHGTVMAEQAKDERIEM